MSSVIHCPETTAAFWAYLGDELDAATADGFRGHLQDCRICAERLARTRTLRTLLRAAAEPEQVPEDVRGRLTRLLDVV